MKYNFSIAPGKVGTIKVEIHKRRKQITAVYSRKHKMDYSNKWMSTMVWSVKKPSRKEL